MVLKVYQRGYQQTDKGNMQTSLPNTPVAGQGFKLSYVKIIPRMTLLCEFYSFLC